MKFEDLKGQLPLLVFIVGAGGWLAWTGSSVFRAPSKPESIGGLPPVTVVQGSTTTLGQVVNIHLAISPAGNLLAAGDESGIVSIRDLQGNVVLDQWANRSGGIHDLRFNRTGDRLAVSSGQSLGVWNVGKGQLLWRFRAGNGTPGYAVHSADFSPDGRFVTCGAAANGKPVLIYTLDAQTGKEVRHWHAHRKRLSSMRYSPDGRHILSTGFDGLAALWRSADGKRIASFKSNTAIWNGEFGTDSNQIIVAQMSAEPRQWSNFGFTGRVISHPGYESRKVSFSPEGTQVLSVERAGYLTIWDAKTQKKVREMDLVNQSSSGGSLDLSRRYYTAPENELCDFVVSKDGKIGVAAWRDGAIKRFALPESVRP